MTGGRVIMNFEAVVAYRGHDEDDQSIYEIQLMVNHHVIYSWPIDGGEAYLLESRYGHLETTVAKKLHELLHGGVK